MDLVFLRLYITWNYLLFKLYFQLLELQLRASKFCPQMAGKYNLDFDIPKQLKAKKKILHIKSAKFYRFFSF